MSAKIKKDQGSYVTVAAGAPTSIGDGYFEFPLTKAETNADSHELIPAHADPDFRVISARNVTTETLSVPFFQLLARKDLAIEVDRAAELLVLNANEGSGNGTYERDDSLQRIRETITLGLGGYPDDSDVRLGVIFGPASEFTGQCRVPPVERVEAGFDYDDQDTLTGTLEIADVPPEADVRTGVVYANATLTGTIELPGESDVLFGVMYGAAGVELTGLLIVDESTDESAIGFTFTQGDDVTLSISNPNNVDLTLATDVTLTIARDRSPYQQILSADGIPAGTGPISVDLTADESAIDSGTWRYDLRARLATGDVVTVDRGWCEVALAYSELPAA